MDYTEKWGKDVEEAIELALVDLRCSRDEVDVKVLEEPTKGFLGIGAKLAKVRVERKKSGKEKKEKKTFEEPIKKMSTNKPQKQNIDAKSIEKSPNKNTERKSPEKKENRFKSLTLDEVNIESLTDVEEHEALTFLKEIAEKMGLELEFKAKTGKELVYLEMNGKDSRTVIGKRGQTLDAIQYLTSLVVNKNNEKYTKVVVDAENYRAKRQKTLEQLANRLASKVIKTKKYVRLEPMNPYERKVIHATLQKNPEITTRSEGDEPYRRVIIELKK